jgi:transcription-repair coupling factor (superfamily II helicase)
VRSGYKRGKEALTLKEIAGLVTPGDYVTHIDHGIGKFAGLEKIEVNGKMQETIRLVYRDNDILYVSIHSLHRISKYSGKEGDEPKINKLGTPAWKALKAKTKRAGEGYCQGPNSALREAKGPEGIRLQPGHISANRTGGFLHL